MTVRPMFLFAALMATWLGGLYWMVTSDERADAAMPISTPGPLPTLDAIRAACASVGDVAISDSYIAVGAMMSAPNRFGAIVTSIIPKVILQCDHGRYEAWWLPIKDQ